jgi:hypothetical protein
MRSKVYMGPIVRVTRTAVDDENSCVSACPDIFNCEVGGMEVDSSFIYCPMCGSEIDHNLPSEGAELKSSLTFAGESDDNEELLEYVDIIHNLTTDQYEYFIPFPEEGQIGLNEYRELDSIDPTWGPYPFTDGDGMKKRLHTALLMHFGYDNVQVLYGIIHYD